MDNFINFIMGGNIDFTAQFIVRFFVFCAMLEMIVSICKSLMSSAKGV